jgi:transposase
VTLTESATAASRSRGSYLSAQYGRVRGRRGHAKAIGAVRHSILVAAYHMFDRGAPYQDLRADWFLRRHSPEHRARQLVHQLKALGYDVEVTYRRPAETSRGGSPTIRHLRPVTGQE